MEQLYTGHLIDCPECGSRTHSNTAWVESGKILSVRYLCPTCHSSIEIGEGHFDVDWHIDSLVYFFLGAESSFPSPADQDCTPDGGVSANRADDNSTGGVTTPEVTWRASGSHSHGGANE